MQAILKVLMPKLKDPSPGVVSSVLSAVGELARVGGEELEPYLDQLFPVIFDTLQDQSSVTKREAALKTIGQLASNTSYVIEPFLRYPNLMNIIVSILKTEQESKIRREAVKLLGILGALDPYKYKVNLLEMAFGDIEMKSNSNGNESEDAPDDLGPSSEDYFPTVVVNALMKILRDPSLSVHHTAVVQAVMYIFKTQGLKCVSFIPQVSTELIE